MIVEYAATPAFQLKKGDVVLIHGQIVVVTEVKIMEGRVLLQTMHPRTGEAATQGNYPAISVWHRVHRKRERNEKVQRPHDRAEGG